MGAIVIRRRYDEGTESAEVATSVLRECQQSWALGMRQHFNTKNRHGPNPVYNCVILVFVTPRMREQSIILREQDNTL